MTQFMSEHCLDFNKVERQHLEFKMLVVCLEDSFMSVFWFEPDLVIGNSQMYFQEHGHPMQFI